jgi:hypothetical protein
MRTPYTIRGQSVVIYMKKHHSEYDHQEIPSKALNVYRGKLVDWAALSQPSYVSQLALAVRGTLNLLGIYLTAYLGLTSEMVERARDHISTKALSIRVFHKSTWTLSRQYITQH